MPSLYDSAPEAAWPAQIDRRVRELDSGNGETYSLVSGTSQDLGPIWPSDRSTVHLEKGVTSGISLSGDEVRNNVVEASVVADRLEGLFGRE
jgi:hypothetical protein